MKNKKINKKNKGFSLTYECLDCLDYILKDKETQFTTASGLIHYLIVDYYKKIKENNICKEEKNIKV